MQMKEIKLLNYVCNICLVLNVNKIFFDWYIFSIFLCFRKLFMIYLKIYKIIDVFFCIYIEIEGQRYSIDMNIDINIY